MDLDKIISKIQKLLSLSESPSIEESSSALMKVQVLLSKYNLSMSDIDQFNTDIEEEVLFESKRPRKWKSILLGAVSEASFIKIIHKKNNYVGQMVMIGKSVNILTAKNLYNFLSQTIEELTEEYQYEIFNKEDFKLGIAQRVYERLQYLQQSNIITSDERAIVISEQANCKKENDDYIKYKYGEVKTKRIKKSLDEYSYAIGRQAGENISLNKQITS